MVATIVSAILIHPYLFSALLGIIAVFSSIELVKLSHSKKTFSISSSLIGGITLITYLVMVAVGFEVLSVSYLWTLLLVLPLLMTIELYRKTNSSLANVAAGFFAVCYTTIPFALLSTIRLQTFGESSGAYFVLTYLVLIWIHDSGAYLVGSTFGKHRLFERISPKKSWEGLIGGLLFSTIAAYFMNDYFHFMPMLKWIILTLIIIVSANFGDLAESMIKRDVGVKDSGNLLPGHGGLLDRFDAVLHSAPFVFVYLQLI